jgi:hypothetical protein
MNWKLEKKPKNKTRKKNLSTMNNIQTNTRTEIESDSPKLIKRWNFKLAWQLVSKKWVTFLALTSFGSVWCWRWTQIPASLDRRDH